MSSLKIEERDLLVGVNMLLGAPHIREEWHESVRTEAPDLYMQMAMWNMANAELEGPKGSPEFTEAIVHFMGHAMLLLGSFWAAHGRHFPPIPNAIIEEASRGVLEEDKLGDEIRETSEEVWEAFMGSSIEVGLNEFGRNMIAVLGVAFLRVAKLQSEEDASLALEELEQNLLADKEG